MKERIIFAPGAKGGELIKNLALHGVNSINLKIMGAGELSRYTLMKAGVVLSDGFVSEREECALVSRAITGCDYFGRTTYTDIRNIAGAVKCMRSLVADPDENAVISDTLNRGIFTEKNEALLTTYQNYRKALSDESSLDSVSLIRKAIELSEPFDADFSVLSEYPLSPLEMALLQKISGGNFNTISISDLYCAQKRDLHIESYKNCYGAPNEVESILNDIYAGKELDRCTVAVTDAGTYSQLFFDYALLHDIPITFGAGVPIMNSNPGRLLVMYYHWITDGFFGRDAINDLLHSKAFDRTAWYEQFPEAPEGFSWSKFYDVLSGLRLTNDAAVNEARLQGYRAAIREEEGIVRESDVKAYTDFQKRKLCIPYLEVAARELALHTEDFISKYSYIRKGSGSNADLLLMKIDMASVNAIYEELGVIRRAGIIQSTDDLIVNALRIGIGGEKSEAGKLHVTTISGALSSVRENLYIAGLSSSNFPGSPSENYLLLDADLKLFGDAAEYLTSEGKIRKKKERLQSLLHLASNLGSRIYVSYSGLNVSELKKDNASSIIFELFREEAGRNVTSAELASKVEKVEYFAPGISATREIGNAMNHGKKILTPELDISQDTGIQVNLDKEWSPSAIQMYLEDFETFVMTYLLGILKPDLTDPFSVIPPMASGTLAHSLMERLANSNLDRDEFLRISGEYFDRYIVEHPPLIMEKVDAEKADFLDMMETAYESDPRREVVLKEEDVHCTHESGVRIHGLPDRVEKLPDGTYAVVDFKSGRTVKHVEDDIQTCLQVVIYGYLMESQGFRISRGEFRYLRTGEVVRCRYDDEMKEQLRVLLENFKKGVQNMEPPIPLRMGDAAVTDSEG